MIQCLFLRQNLFFSNILPVVLLRALNAILRARYIPNEIISSGISSCAVFSSRLRIKISFGTHAGFL
jgi:hypothetical protein